MKVSLIILMQIALIVFGSMACKTEGMELSGDSGMETEKEGLNPDNTTANRMVVKIGSKTFTATLANNATVAEFKSRLPLTISMEELNGNEKYYHFSKNLPSNPSRPNSIEIGDLMLYTSNTLVLFYEAFSTSYTYTRIGKIEDTSGLAAAVGNGNVTVSFALE